MLTTLGRTLVLLALTVGAAAPARAQDDEGVQLLLRRIERVVRAGDAAAYFTLLSAGADRERAADFASSELMPGVSRSVLQERDRSPLAGAANNGYRMMVDVMAEFGTRARIATWRLDVKRTGKAGAEDEWTIADEERISSVESIYRLTLSTTTQYAARDLKISAEDLDLTLPEGSVFVAEIDSGVTAVVLLGKGTLNFHPAPATEKGQVKIFCGSETLETRFDTAYIRLNPADFESFFASSALQKVAVDSRSLQAGAGRVS